MRLLAGRQIIKDGRGSNRSTTDGDKLTQTASLENLAEPSVLVNPEKRQICEWSKRQFNAYVRMTKTLVAAT
jgi:hypothetical protein